VSLSLLLKVCRVVRSTDAALNTTDTTWFLGSKLNILSRGGKKMKTVLEELEATLRIKIKEI